MKKYRDGVQLWCMGATVAADSTWLPERDWKCHEIGSSLGIVHSGFAPALYGILVAQELHSHSVGQGIYISG
jgi:hypothetical protein